MAKRLFLQTKHVLVRHLFNDNWSRLFKLASSIWSSIRFFFQIRYLIRTSHSEKYLIQKNSCSLINFKFILWFPKSNSTVFGESSCIQSRIPFYFANLPFTKCRYIPRGGWRAVYTFLWWADYIKWQKPLTFLLATFYIGYFSEIL